MWSCSVTIMPTADSEVLRAKGGGLLRGFSYNLAEAPVGVGGPASPLVTSAASSTVAVGSVPTNPSELGVLAEQQTNLSILGTIPLSNGPRHSSVRSRHHRPSELDAPKHAADQP